MPSIDLLTYRGFDTGDHAVPPVGTPARQWLGDGFEGLYVAAVCPPIHEGCAATVVLAHRSDGMPEVVERLNRPAA